MKKEKDKHWSHSNWNKKDEIDEIINWLKEIVWCNAHDSAWIEETIKRLKKLKQGEKT